MDFWEFLNEQKATDAMSKLIHGGILIMKALSLCLMCAIWGSGMETVQGAEAPEIPRIDSVVMSKPQPYAR